MADNTWSNEGFHFAGMAPAAGQIFGATVANALASAGSTITDATNLTAQRSVVATSSATTTGVKFDPSLLVPGAIITIRNNAAANAFKVYAGAAVQIDGGTAGASVDLAHAATGNYLVVTTLLVYTI
ncbi:MAG: hypothetical protein V4457_12820 [Pseudomonadota bacterium]